MQAIQNFFYKAPAPMATKPMEVSSEKELLERVEERIKASLINQDICLTFLPASQEDSSCTMRFGYHENNAKKLPNLSHSFIISTKETASENDSYPYTHLSQTTNEGKFFYSTEGNFQKFLTPVTVHKIDALVRAKLQEMNPSNKFASKEEVAKTIDRALQNLELRFKDIRESISKDLLLPPNPKRSWFY